MKLKGISAFAITICFLLTGCRNSDSLGETAASNDSMNGAAVSEEEYITSEEQPLTNHENSIVYYSEEEVADIIAGFPNMKLSDSVYLLAPKEIDL